MRTPFLPRALLVCLATLPLCAGAQTEPIDPLAFKSQATEAETPRLGLRIEAWAQGVDLNRRVAGDSDLLGRTALDYRHEWQINETLRATLSDRMEALQGKGSAADQQRNALRELFLSCKATPATYLDAGRINFRQGVASGYNPSDWLRENAVVMRSSQSPAALRENRLGAVMLRAQIVDTLGSMQLALLPQLSEAKRFDDDFWSPGLERTNRQRAALLRISPRTGERLVMDITGFARAGDTPQLGSNLSYTASDSLVLQLEWSRGKRAALAAPGETSGPTKSFNRIATGGTWTTPAGLTLTLEHHYAGDALNKTNWNAWRNAKDADALTLGELRRGATGRQDLLVRHYWFGRLGWDRAFDLAMLDISAIARHNAYDHSTMLQLDASWHVSDRLDLAMMLNRMTGANNSELGAAPARSALAVYLRYFM